MATEFLGRVSLAAGLALLWGCSKAAPPDPTPFASATITGETTTVASAQAPKAATPNGLGKVHGVVQYAGPERATSLYVGLLKDKKGQPQFARQIKWPTYPSAFFFNDVPPGDYFLGGYLALGPDHATGPVAKDPVITPVAIKVTADGVVTQDLTVPGSGGSPADAGHRPSP